MKVTYSEKDASNKYFVKNTEQHLVRVWRETFVNILSISARRVNTTLKKCYHTGNVDEKTGDFRKKAEYQDKKESQMYSDIETTAPVKENMCSMWLQLRERITSAKDETEKGTLATEPIKLALKISLKYCMTKIHRN
ncbi:hypothetical protein PR048_001027 [Dryococelus australis]|uniref:Uncharacterized protein n=1 Tax=Dryococelus australis TaxID=614101 RepID=A0ABQ9IGA5_9NEOP|nr:hypothetical protein PR048_001027 [Dryococelus australis]